MTLNSLIKGQSALVIALNVDKALKNRFNSFGLTIGATVHVEQCTLTGQTMIIRIDKTHIALRLSEAKQVEISQ